MCSSDHFSKRMENYQGDLADIVRATASTVEGGAAGVVPDWHFPTNPIINYSSDVPAEDFGDPFTYMRDPLFQNTDTTTPAPEFFYNSNMIKAATHVEDDTGGFAGSVTGNDSSSSNLVDDHEIRRPSNIFSRMLQISPNAKLPIPPPCDSQGLEAPTSPTGLKGPPPLLTSGNRNLISSKGCLVESPGRLQISSPRNTGIKRRKNQAKKVVCIPAPTPANSRASGEVVPSDLWAWRKYGQKPIKGSPYPRGYYRCSSSKGCSARKQVERSRTDPNMLVITYTSEHNHPWPTQRNALAGCTRSQASKNHGAAKNSPNSQAQKPKSPKEEQKDISTENTVSSSGIDTNSATVKEETDQELDNQLEIDDTEFDEVFPHGYKPTFSDSTHTEDSFFADLGEIGADPLDLLFTQGFPGDEGRENKVLDPFSFYDWAANNSNITGATTSYGESKRDS
ncbi:putative WRKY transcription factor 14 [Sesamum alatum]|uniref:WRKY transcription factor 14 n=1 Tax=Sesamum alatum TaxID=300844 RepID=A0AAE1XZN8_9LAMI|nr:putative WRKY transcription factor 14 [Sesamum alatum]